MKKYKNKSLCLQKETLVFIHKESSIFSFNFAVSVIVEDHEYQ